MQASLVIGYLIRRDIYIDLELWVFLTCSVAQKCLWIVTDRPFIRPTVYPWLKNIIYTFLKQICMQFYTWNAYKTFNQMVYVRAISTILTYNVMLHL
jgi:hypothetical protein